MYATREGQTEKVAARIAGHLKRAGASVELVNARDPVAVNSIELDNFDLLAFGASMHAGGLERELVDYIVHHKKQIESHKRSFFLVLLSAAVKERKLRESWLADARTKMNDQLAVRFEDIEMIPGALTYSKYSLPIKWVMQRIARKAGEGTDTRRDYEYTDWEQVRQYAERLGN